MNENKDEKIDELLSLSKEEIDEIIKKLSLYEIELLLARLYEVTE